MGMFRSMIRFITTLGGLLSSKVDEGTDAITTTPAGVKAAYRTARGQWTKQYHEVRDAVSQLMMVIEQKRAEIVALRKEQDELETKKRGAVERFKATREEKFQTAFSDYHKRLGEVDARQTQLAEEVETLEKQIEGYKLKLTEMQSRIRDLDKQEAEAIADIVTSKQIVDLNDRMAKLSTSLHDENLVAIDKTRARMKAKAKLSDELAGTDRALIDQEVMAAGMTGEAGDEFARMLAESELREKERGGGIEKSPERTV